MLMHAKPARALAQLLNFMARGEIIAHECARRQAEFAPTGKMRRFLQGQARQEAMHAGVFATAAAWLAPQRSKFTASLAPLERYHALLQDALERKNFTETLLAEQLIFEGLGEVILRRLASGLSQRALPVERLCRRLLAQEHAHHRFGDQLLERAMRSGEVSRASLRARGQDYWCLVEAMLASLADELGTLNEDASDYLAETRRTLPDWLTSNESTALGAGPNTG